MYLQNVASIQPRTSPKYGYKISTIFVFPYFRPSNPFAMASMSSHCFSVRGKTPASSFAQASAASKCGGAYVGSNSTS